MKTVFQYTVQYNIIIYGLCRVDILYYTPSRRFVLHRLLLLLLLLLNTYNTILIIALYTLSTVTVSSVV